VLRRTNRLFLSIIGAFFAGLTLVFLLASARLVMAPVNLDWASSAIIWFLTPEGQKAQIEIEGPELRLDTSTTSLELYLARFTYKDVSGYEVGMDGFSLKPSISDFVSSLRFLPQKMKIDRLVMTVPNSGEGDVNSSLFVFRDWLETVTNSGNDMGGLETINIALIELLQEGVAGSKKELNKKPSYFYYNFANSRAEIDADISFKSAHGNSNILVKGEVSRSGGGNVTASVSKFRPDELALFVPVLQPLSQVPLPLDLAAEIRFGDDFVPSFIDANLYLGKAHVQFKELSLHVDEISAKLQVDVATQSVSIDSIYVSYEKNRAEFSGTLDYDATRTGRLDKLSGDLIGKALQLKIPSLWDTPVRSQQISFSFDLDRANQVFSLAQFRIYLNGLIVDTSGEVRIARDSPDDLEIDLTSQVGAFELEQALALWPVKFAPLTKSWVRDNINTVKTELGTARLTGLLSEWRKFGTDVRPNPSIIDIEIPFYDANIRYLPYLPPLQNVRGSIFISGDSFHATASEGLVDLTQLASSQLAENIAGGGEFASDPSKQSKLAKVSKAQFYTPKFSAGGGIGKASFTVEGNVDALLTAVEVPQINALKRTSFSAQDFVGTAVADVELKFPMGRPYKPGSVDFSVSANLDKFALERPVFGYKVSDSRLLVDVTPQDIRTMGIGLFNGVALNYEYKTDFRVERDLTTAGENDPLSSLSLFGSVTPDDLIELRLPKLAPHFDGKVTFNLLLDQYAVQRTDIRLINKLAEANLHPLRLNYNKPIGVAADMVVSIKIVREPQLMSAEFSYLSEAGDRVQLNAKSANGELNYLNIDPFKLGDAYDFTAIMGENTSGAQKDLDEALVFRVTGTKFDISKLLKSDKAIASEPEKASPVASKAKTKPKAVSEDGAKSARNNKPSDGNLDLPKGEAVVMANANSLISSLAIRFPQNSSFDIRLAKLQGANDLMLDGFGLSAIRVDGRLEKLQSSGVFSSGSEVFTSLLRSSGGERKFAVQAENAGELLSAFGYLDGLENGALSIAGSVYDVPIVVDDVYVSVEGNMALSEFKVRDLPVLAQLLSLASFGGIADTLGGNGLRFNGADATFTYYNGRLDIDRAKASGSALGLTLQGAVDYNLDRISLGGNLVPAYALNSLIGEIPVIGKLFTSRDGEGVVGVNYRIFGAASDPSIVVNPLSIFTPGFLRQIFELGVGDLPSLGQKPKTSREEQYFTR